MSEERPTIYLYDRLRAVHELLRAAKAPINTDPNASSFVVRHAVQRALDVLEQQLTLLLGTHDADEPLWGKMFWCSNESVWWSGATHICPEKVTSRLLPATREKGWRLTWEVPTYPDMPDGPFAHSSCSFETLDRAVAYAREHAFTQPGARNIRFEHKNAVDQPPSTSSTNIWRLSWNILDHTDDLGGPESTASCTFFTPEYAIEYLKTHVFKQPGVVGVWLEYKRATDE